MIHIVGGVLSILGGLVGMVTLVLEARGSVPKPTRTGRRSWGLTVRRTPRWLLMAALAAMLVGQGLQHVSSRAATRPGAVVASVVVEVTGLVVAMLAIYLVFLGVAWVLARIADRIHPEQQVGIAARRPAALMAPGGRGDQIGTRQAPRRAELAVLAALFGALLAIVGTPVAVALVGLHARTGRAEMIGSVSAVLVGAGILYAAARALAWYRTFPLKGSTAIDAASTRGGVPLDHADTQPGSSSDSASPMLLPEERRGRTVKRLEP